MQFLLCINAIHKNTNVLTLNLLNAPVSKTLYLEHTHSLIMKRKKKVGCDSVGDLKALNQKVPDKH